MTGSMVDGKIRAELSMARAERAALRNGLVALLAQIEAYVPGCGACAEDGKRNAVMVRQGPYMACDDHGVVLDRPEDLSYASVVRRTRALLEVVK